MAEEGDGGAAGGDGTLLIAGLLLVSRGGEIYIWIDVVGYLCRCCWRWCVIG